MASTLLARFTAKYRVQTTGKRCWLWTGAKDSSGYGQMRGEGGIHAKVEQAHRIAWQIFRGPIPAGLEIDHLCEVKACVNPDHLEPLTQAQNTHRYFAKRYRNCKHGTKPFGGGHCPACNRERVRKYRNAKRAAGLCGVGACRVRTGARSHCPEHAEALSVYHRKWYRRRKRELTRGKVEEP
jgi:hypothetical protein